MEMVNQTERQFVFSMLCLPSPIVLKYRLFPGTFTISVSSWGEGGGGGGGEAVNRSFGRSVLPKHTFTEVNFFPTDLIFFFFASSHFLKHFQFLRRFKMLILKYFNLTQEPVILFSAARTYPLRQSGGVPGEGLIHFVSLNQM